MTLLVTIRGWDVDPWVDRFRRLLPDKRIVTPQDDFDRSGVHYVATWKHPPGALRDLPALKAIFSLGAGVDHLRPPRRPSTSCRPRWRPRSICPSSPPTPAAPSTWPPG